MKKIIHCAHILAPPTRVFEALTTENGLSGWWSTDTTVEEPAEGGRIRFRFQEDFNPVMKVTSLKEDALVEWKCVDGHDNWKDNSFRFSLEELDEAQATKLIFVQQYREEFPDEIYGTYNFNWGYYLDSLKQLSETGSGKPFTPKQPVEPSEDPEAAEAALKAASNGEEPLGRKKQKAGNGASGDFSGKGELSG